MTLEEKSSWNHSLHSKKASYIFRWLEIYTMTAILTKVIKLFWSFQHGFVQENTTLWLLDSPQSSDVLKGPKSNMGWIPSPWFKSFSSKLWPHENRPPEVFLDTLLGGLQWTVNLEFHNHDWIFIKCPFLQEQVALSRAHLEEHDAEPDSSEFEWNGANSMWYLFTLQHECYSMQDALSHLFLSTGKQLASWKDLKNDVRNY